MRSYQSFMKKKRIDWGLTMNSMAEELGCSAAWISAIENEKVGMPKNFGKRLLKTFDFTDEEKIELESILSRLSDLTIKLVDYKEDDRELISNLFKYFEHLTNSNKSKIRQMLDRIECKINKTFVRDNKDLEQQDDIDTQDILEQQKNIEQQELVETEEQTDSESIQDNADNKDLLSILDELYKKREELGIKEETVKENENNIELNEKIEININNQENEQTNESFDESSVVTIKHEDKNLQNLFKKINEINNDVNNDVLLNVK